MKISRFLILIAALLFTTQNAWAGEQNKPIKAVLMPISASFSQQEITRLTDEVAEAFSPKYQVLHGKDVVAAIKGIFDEENKKGLNCDLDKCYQSIARHFGVEFIVSFLATPKGDGSMDLAVTILNVLENKVVLQKRAVSKGKDFGGVLKAGVSLIKG